MKSNVLNFRWGSLLPLLILISCASKSEKKFNSLLKAGKCEEAALHVPEFKIEKAVEQGMTYTATGASYVLASAAYGVDVVYFLTGGVILPVVVCSPVIYLDARTTVSSGQVSGKCVEAVHKGVMKNYNSVGKTVYKKTAPWRCPDFDFAVENLVKISDCYKAEGNYAKARLQINNILDEETFGGCVSDQTRRDLEEKLDSIH